MDAVAPRVADRAGMAVLRFNYGYGELMVRSGKPRPPERMPALKVVHRAAHECAREMFPDIPLLAGGKSLGGRVSSLMAAEGEAVDGLCFLGYPLHPPGKQDRLRTEHFPQLKGPALFLQGDRDALCDLGLLEEAVKGWGKAPTVHIVEGGDHSFNVLRRSGRNAEDVLEEIATAIHTWWDSIAPKA